MVNAKTTRGAALIGVAVSLALGGCMADDEPMSGLHATEIDGVTLGPAVRFEPRLKPDAEIPFPNDLAMAISADGGVHVNVSGGAPTLMERRIRKHFAEVPGFSAMSPISVSFDGPVDLATVNDDSVLVINVEPDSARYGEVVPIDLGRGWFPHTAEPHNYFPHDPMGNFDSFVLPPDNKVDSDGDGKADKWVYHYETATDTLDIRPIVPLEAGSKYAIVLTRAIEGLNKDGKTRGSLHSPFPYVNHPSQTAALKLALPTLQERGLDAKDVAFAWTMTTGDLSRTFRALREGLYGRGKFGWLDAAVPARIKHIYKLDIDFDGVDDKHPDAHPGNKGYPFVKRDHDRIVQQAFLQSIFQIVAGVAPETVGDGSFKYVDYAVFGDMETPSLRQRPADEHNAANVWDVDLEAGTATVESIKVPFMITVPKTTLHHKPPFPVIVYAHATGTSRVESLLLADRFARAGIAVFTIDAIGHGPVLANAREMIGDFAGGGGGHLWGCECGEKPACNADKLQAWRTPACSKDSQCDDQCQSDTSMANLVKALLGALLFKDVDKKLPEGIATEKLFDVLLANGFLAQLGVHGRAVDDNGDCRLNGTPGEAYYAPNTFRLRDSMRQTTLDYIVAVRLLRALTQGAVPAAIDDPRAAEKTPEGEKKLMANLLAGDFNADGVLDIGGPDNHYFMTGISLGGIHTALTSPLEPHIVAAAPVVAGAGLADIFIRTSLHGVITPLMHKVSGPVVAGCVGKGAHKGKVLLSWNDDMDRCRKATMKSYRTPDGKCLSLPISVKSYVAESELIAAGTKLRVTNLDNGGQVETVALKDGGFAASIASDKGDRVQVEVLDKDGKVVETHQLKSPYEGVGRPRNTPRFRRFVQSSSNILEGADAITVADRMFQRPLAGHSPTNVLLMLGVGDRTVNYAAGLALARAIGLFGKGADYTDMKHYKAWTEQVIGDGVLANVQKPATPQLDAARPEGGPGMCRRVRSGATGGVSALCLADVQGKHEYIAQPSKGDRFPPLKGFSDATYTEYHRNMIVSYFHSLGTKVNEDPCWASAKCSGDKGQGLMKQWDGPIKAAPVPAGLK